MKKEVFPYSVPEGAVMDFVEDRFLLVIKDEDWNEDQIRLCQSTIACHICYTADLFIVVVEGGAIDSSDFYFDVHQCDWKEQLFKQECLQLDLLLLNKENEVCLRKSKTLNKEETSKVIEALQRQDAISFMPEEYDVNVEGIQSAYEPFELTKFSLVQCKF